MWMATTSPRSHWSFHRPLRSSIPVVSIGPCVPEAWRHLQASGSSLPGGCLCACLHAVTLGAAAAGGRHQPCPPSSEIRRDESPTSFVCMGMLHPGRRSSADTPRYAGCGRRRYRHRQTGAVAGPWPVAGADWQVLRPLRLRHTRRRPGRTDTERGPASSNRPFRFLLGMITNAGMEERLG